jgi:hypothetical protein
VPTKRSALLLLTVSGLLALLVGPTAVPANHPRPAGATPTRVALVPALKPCVSPNAQHGPPVSTPSCSPPEQTSDYLTVGTNDANGEPPKSTGFVRTDVFFCPPCAAAVNEDLMIRAQITDVRRRSDLADYAGELQGNLAVRITDHYNAVTGAPAPECSATTSCPATVQDFNLPFPMPCQPTSDNTIGSSCEAQTSANAVLPGVTRMFSRATWQLDQVEVFDGGADGDADTPDNTLFAVQGVFLP